MLLRARRRLLLVRLSLAVIGCTGPATSALPPAPTTIPVTMTEYSFDYAGPVPAGRVVFRVKNSGKLVHQLSLFPISKDVPPLEMQLHGSERRVANVFASVTVQPGEAEVFAVDLSPGHRYGMMCFLQDAFGQANALKGMNAEFITPNLGLSGESEDE